MMNPDCGSAILFFSLSPEVQTQQKQWKGVSKALARKTHARLFQHTSAIISKSGLPCIHSDEHNQVGLDFGSKLGNAVESVFSQGYSSVIVLGNDCPELNQEILKSAILELKTNKLVVGPSQSGGVYLMGFHASNFDKENFQNLPWQNKQLQNSLLEYFHREINEVAFLPFLANLNQYEELSFFTGIKSICKNIIQVFEALIQCFFKNENKYYKLIHSCYHSHPHPLRGPPASC